MPLSQDDIQQVIQAIRDNPELIRNAHFLSDVDSDTNAQHHSLGQLPTQASPGGHKHTGKDGSFGVAELIAANGELATWDGATLFVPGVVTSEGINVKVSNTTVLSTDANGHVGGRGTAPTVVAGANNGGTPPAPAMGTNSTDQQGGINIGSGTAPAAGAQAVVTFNRAYTTLPRVILEANNVASANMNAYVSVTNAGFTVQFPTAPTASQTVGTYSFHYVVLG